jgi:hypothetical protein
VTQTTGSLMRRERWCEMDGLDKKQINKQQRKEIK